MGVQVILACRSEDRGEAAAKEIADTTSQAGVTAMDFDFSSLASSHAFDNASLERLAAGYRRPRG
jgi:hypothetical protein